MKGHCCCRQMAKGLRRRDMACGPLFEQQDIVRGTWKKKEGIWICDEQRQQICGRYVRMPKMRSRLVSR